MEDVASTAWIWIMLIQGLICGGFCAFLAREKGRESGWWFLMGLFFSIIALIAVAASPTVSATKRTRLEGAQHVTECKKPDPQKEVKYGLNILIALVVLAGLMILVFALLLRSRTG